MVSVIVEGAKEAKRFLDNKQMKLSNSLIPQAIKDATIFLQGEVKLSIAGNRAEPKSVDTGRFLNSVDLVTTKDNGAVFTDLSYAKGLEFGTSRLKARKHFNNSKDRNAEKIKQIVQKDVDKL